MPSDHHVMDPDELACTGSAFRKREYVQSCTELLDSREIFMQPCRFFRAIDQLGESDNRDSKLIRKVIKTLA
jgi:hypothetical protein